MSCGDSGPVLPRVAVAAGPLVAFAVEAAVAGSSVWCRGYDVVTAAGQPVSASRGGAQQSPSPRLAWASISAAGMPSPVLLFPGAPGWWGAGSSAQKSGLHDASGRGGATVKFFRGWQEERKQGILQYSDYHLCPPQARGDGGNILSIPSPFEGWRPGGRN